MFKHLKYISVFAIVTAFSTPLHAEGDLSLSSVMATVNGTEITLGHMVVAKATLPEQYQQLPDDVLFPGILEQLVQQTALQQSYDGELPAQVALALENERRSLIAGEAIEDILQTAVTEQALQTIYNATYANTEGGTEYNASHILVESEEEAQALVNALREGADFATTARESSTGPSGPGGGSLGWFGTGAMVPAFEAAVIALDVGTISEPVQTQFGWHVIKLNETRQAEAPTLEDVRTELEQQVRNAAVTTALEALTGQGNVDQSGAEGVDPSILSTLTLD